MPPGPLAELPANVEPTPGSNDMDRLEGPSTAMQQGDNLEEQQQRFLKDNIEQMGRNKQRLTFAEFTRAEGDFTWADDKDADRIATEAPNKTFDLYAQERTAHDFEMAAQSHALQAQKHAIQGPPQTKVTWSAVASKDTFQDRDGFIKAQNKCPKRPTLPPNLRQTTPPSSLP